MPLVKKSELSGKSGGRATQAAVMPPTTPHTEEFASKRREQNRSRARLEKAAERIGAATEQLAAGISQAAAAAEELSRSLGQIEKAAMQRIVHVDQARQRERGQHRGQESRPGASEPSRAEHGEYEQSRQTHHRPRRRHVRQTL